MPETDQAPPTRPADAQAHPASSDPAPAPEAEPGPAPGPAPDDPAPLVGPERLPAAVEAVLLSVDKPLGSARIAQALNLDDAGSAAVAAAIDALNTAYAQTGRSFRIEKVAGGYRVMTEPEFAPAVAAVRGLRDSQKLSRAALETLAIVAYRQPITRAGIEAIRGVASGEVLRSLLERRLIAIVGRAEELGRPMLYGTAKGFLEAFGLSSVKDLPPVGEFFPSVDLTPLDPDGTDPPNHAEPANTDTTPDQPSQDPSSQRPASPTKDQP